MSKKHFQGNLCCVKDPDAIHITKTSDADAQRKTAKNCEYSSGWQCHCQNCTRQLYQSILELDCHANATQTKMPPKQMIKMLVKQALTHSQKNSPVPGGIPVLPTPLKVTKK